MAVDTLTEGSDTYYSSLVPVYPETANAIYALGGNDYVQGNGYVDFIHGGAGNDTLLGMGGNDILLGDGGADQLEGGSGNDLLVGDNGSSGGTGDVLYGGTGEDRMYGNVGNDSYVYQKSDGSIDIVNDDLSAANATGFGGGTDSLFILDVAAADLRFFQVGNDLYVTDVADISDGVINTGVNIQNFFLGGNNVVEYVYGSDYGFDISSWA